MSKYFWREVHIAKQKRKKRPKKKKTKNMSIPYDVALLVMFGTLMFILFSLTNWVCNSRNEEDIPAISINVQHFFEQNIQRD